jgi:hypothetical protein
MGVTITAISIATFFWWGVHFEVFGNPIDLVKRPVGTIGFFAWMLAGIFGSGYAAGGIRAGLLAAGTTMLLLGTAVVIGVLSGNYR